jgi:predicted dehydrogenase
VFRMEKLNVAVIGLGVMGQTHARIYSEMPNVQLVAVHDINHVHAENMEKEQLKKQDIFSSNEGM